MPQAVSLIDLVQVRHHGKNLHGTMWRLYPNERKTWKWEGLLEDGTVLGRYRARRGVGKGLILLYRTTTNWRLWGTFLEPLTRDYGPAVLTESDSAPMEWLDLAHCKGDGFRKWIAVLPETAKLDYPFRARHALVGVRRWRELQKAGAANAPPDSLSRDDVIPPRASP